MIDENENVERDRLSENEMVKLNVWKSRLFVYQKFSVTSEVFGHFHVFVFFLKTDRRVAVEICFIEEHDVFKFCPPVAHSELDKSAVALN